MTTPPESSSGNPQPSPTSADAIADFEAGLTVLKEAEYAAAIVLLEPALSEPLRHPVVIRAWMGLAIAYEKMGETHRAIDLCQQLQQQGHASVQDWAGKTLASIYQQHPEFAPREAARPAPVQPPPSQPSPDSSPNDTDDAGFTRLDQTTLPPVTPVADPGSPTAAGTPDDPTTGITRIKARRTPVSPPPSPEPVIPFQPQWRQAGRAKQWKPIGSQPLWKLILVQVITAIALFFSVQQWFYQVSVAYGTMIVRTLPRLGFRVIQPGNPTWTELATLIILLVLLLGSRWILDAVLTIGYGLKPLSLSELGVHSPEAAASLPRFCRKSGIPVPKLGILPTSAPMILSYGVIPHLSRTVVSQGLLSQLADDEIAALYANEVGHLSRWTVPLLSAIAVLLQLPYTLYWVTAEWGNRKDSPITKFSATLIASVSYGFFWFWRWVPLGLTRYRTQYSDRSAADLTGNPNGYTRALVKLAIATATDVQKQGQASYLLEGFEILSPLGYRLAVPLGSLYAHAPLETLLAWDHAQPLRSWLAINTTHPPTGDRLHSLTRYARHWRLEPELDWQDSTTRRRPQVLTGAEWRSLWLQGAPYFGVGVGLAIAIALRILGTIGQRFRWAMVSWMATDQTLLTGLPLVFLCIGILIRLNPFFPEVPRALTPAPKALLTLMGSPDAIPVNSPPVQLEGKLLGRRGISNVLNQDLWLQTATGIVKLHAMSRFGFFSIPFRITNRADTLVKSNLTATGWLRRGVFPWMDIDTLRSSGGRTHRSFHPIWSFAIAATAAAWGILTLFNIRF